MVNEGFDDKGGCPGIVGNLLVGNPDAIEIVSGLGSFSEGKLEVDMHGKAQGHDVCVVLREFQGGSVLRQGV